MNKNVKDAISEKYVNEMQKKANQAVGIIPKWSNLMESNDYSKVPKHEFGLLATLLEEQQKYVEVEGLKETGFKTMKSLVESNVNDTTAIQNFLKILVPTVRRSYKQMTGMELVGVQPTTVPTAVIYALRFMYAGDKDLKANKPTNLDRVNGTDLNFMSYITTFDFKAGGTFADINYDSAYGNYSKAYLIKSTTATPNTELDSKSIATLLTDGTAVIFGDIVYAESKLWSNNGGNVATDDGAKILLNRFVNPNTSAVAPFINVATDVPAGNNKYWIVCFDKSATPVITLKKEINLFQASLKNEMGFQMVFRNYVGHYTTNQGEYAGSTDSGSVKFRTVKMTMERISLETVTKVLNFEYTEEQYQDMKSQFGISVDTELQNFATFELANNINAMLLQAILQVATQTTQWSYGYAGIAQQSTPPAAYIADGIRMTEKFDTIAAKINHEANQIAIATRKARGNYIVVTPNVLTMLQSTSNGFSPAGGDDLLVSGLSYAGMYNRMKVYVDTYNIFDGDYCLVGYKGASALDAGVIYAPYQTLMVKKVVNPDTGNEKVIFKTRSAIVNSIWGSERYYRFFTVDLSKSLIGA